ncbi:MAG TPA: acyl-CoA synthetase [Burkholderiales bacterium]|nr:acyl-CoA synthetase [Burkholderiales bacterium]
MRYTWSDEITPAHPALTGHFPGNPVVPGAVLLSRVMHAAEQGFGPGIKIVAVPATKFSAVLHPGEKFDVSLEMAGDSLIRFVITRGETRIASGSLRYLRSRAGKTVSEAWLAQRERGSLTAMRLLIWLTLKLGRNAARIFLYPICAYFIVFSLHARRASRLYLSRVLGRKTGWRDLFRHYHTFASTIHDRVYLLSGQHGYFDVQVHGLDSLECALERGAGCVLLGSHLGSFEILRAYGTLEKKLPINILMHMENASKINRAVHGLHTEIPERIIPLGKPQTLLQVKECLERGEIVGVLGDRTFQSDKAVSCRFLGEEARFPEGPLLMAALLEVPVVLFFGFYRGGRRYDINFEAFAQRITLDPSRRSEELREWVERYVNRLEYYCRQAPYNWFNFYDFWRNN